VNDSHKKTSSTVGMKKSVETSELLQYRVNKCVPERTKDIIEVNILTINVIIYTFIKCYVFCFRL
jgi:mevalonate pyrophosphate decarboxylase